MKESAPMRRRIGRVLALLALATGLPPTECFAETSVAKQIPSTELKSDIDEAKTLRRDLRRRMGLIAEPVGNYVSITSFGGLPSSTSTVTLWSGTDGLWRLEQVDKPYNFKTNRLGRAKLRKTVVVQSTSDKISRLLSSVELFREAPGLDGGCTDQPILVIEIVFNGRRREAARTGCPPEDLTWKLVEAVYEAEPKVGR